MVINSSVISLIIIKKKIYENVKTIAYQNNGEIKQLKIGLQNYAFQITIKSRVLTRVTNKETNFSPRGHCK